MRTERQRERGRRAMKRVKWHGIRQDGEKERESKGEREVGREGEREQGRAGSEHTRDMSHTWLPHG